MVMLSFCKKTVHSFFSRPLSSNDFKDDVASTVVCNVPPPLPLPLPAGGFSFLFDISGNDRQPPNLVESADVKYSPTKRDPGGRGFLDEIGGSIDGMMSCTESLGSESSDERRVDDHVETNRREFSLIQIPAGDSNRRTQTTTVVEKSKDTNKMFPPPLSSLTQDGKPTFFLRPARKDGRLELTAVKIDRPEILRSFRQGGRLQLHLIPREEDELEAEAEPNILEGIQENDRKNKVKENTEMEIKDPEEGKEWQTPMTTGAGDGLRRCHQPVRRSQHHHHNSDVWRDCVTIR